ncbi:MAG: hypothetical protein QX199_07845 [Methylococcaceae bacterium]
MITALHFKRNRTRLRMLVLVLLVSWISLTISATCTMPMPSALKAMSEHMQGCAGALKHTSNTMQDCSFKPCLDSQANSLTDSNRLVKPDNLPVFILVLILTFLCLFLSYPPPKIPPKADPPLGRRILLIYRFCTLLN